MIRDAYVRTRISRSLRYGTKCGLINRQVYEVKRPVRLLKLKMLWMFVK